MNYIVTLVTQFSHIFSKIRLLTHNQSLSNITCVSSTKRIGTPQSAVTIVVAIKEISLIERAWRHTLGAAILYSPLERKVVRNRQVSTRTRTRLEGLWEEQQKGRKGTIERTVEAPLGRPRYTNIRGHHRKGLLGDI